MLRKLIYIACLPVLLGFHGCKTAKVVQSGGSDSTVIMQDSGVTEILREDIRTIAEDDAYMNALLECDSNKVRLKQILDYKAGLHARIPEISLNNNILSVHNKVDSFQIFLRWVDRYRWNLKEKVRIQTQTFVVTKTTNVLKWHQRLFMWIGRITLAAAVLIGLWKLIKRRLSI